MARQHTSGGIRILAAAAGLIASFSTAANAQSTVRVSVATGGTQGTGGMSFWPSLSADARFVAFESAALNLVPGDTNGWVDVFVHDIEAGTTDRVSVATGGTQGTGGHSSSPSISADGRLVAFTSNARNLVPGDTNFWSDVFVHDRQTGTTERVSVATDGTQATGGHSSSPSISADGRFVAFESGAENLDPLDSNGWSDVFVRDRQAGTTERVSIATGGAQGDGGGADPSISADGRFVAFESQSANLVSGDTNEAWDVFVHDRQTGTTERVSVATGGAQAEFGGLDPSISADGRFVAFVSLSADLVAGDTNGVEDIFVHDRQTGTTERVSLVTGGRSQALGGPSSWPSISADGLFVAFGSSATNLVPGDTNQFWDVFVNDRGSFFETFCFGDGSGSPCPCGNEALFGSGGGCANDQPLPAGQGARLSASGSASVAADDVVLTVEFTSDQPGLFVQGNNAVNGGAGLLFGDGLRCCGGSVLRLEIADPPSSTVPSSASTTLPILATSPAGTTLPGDVRCYQWWYRNPASTLCGANFNLSNAVQVTWRP